MPDSRYWDPIASADFFTGAAGHVGLSDIDAVKADILTTNIENK